MLQIDPAQIVIDVPVLRLKLDGFTVGGLRFRIIFGPIGKIAEKKVGRNRFRILFDRGLILLRRKIELPLGFVDPAEFIVLLGRERIVQDNDPGKLAPAQKGDHDREKENGRRPKRGGITMAHV